MKEDKSLSVQQIVDALELEAHVEGGYFKQTFKANDDIVIDTAKGPRVTLTSIYYLLTADSPIGHFHMNTSDIMHYFHGGDPITYYLIYPNGELKEVILGPDLLAGHQLQFVVSGGVWKASRIATQGVYGYGLIGEAVAPGFEYSDMTLGKTSQLVTQFPQHSDLIQSMSRESVSN